MKFETLLDALETKIAKDSKYSASFAAAISESENILELQDEVAQWVDECKGSPEIANTWILNYLFEDQIKPITQD